jgi:hypothetical protein
MRVGRQLTTSSYPYAPTPHPQPQPVETAFGKAATICHDSPLRPPLTLVSDPIIDGLTTTCRTFPGFVAVRELRALRKYALVASDAP